MRADGVNAPALTPTERRVSDHIRAHESDLVELLRTLIRFDTVTHTTGAPAREEEALQAFVAGRLREVGADVEVAEPDPRLVAGHRMIPDGLTFTGRPQLVGRILGADGGRTLLLNGHADVVAPGPSRAWRHDPSPRSWLAAPSTAAARAT